MSIAPGPLGDFVRTIFEHAGCPPEEAATVSAHLIDANLMGHDSHGVIRVLPYIEMLTSGRWRAGTRGRIVKDAGALVTIDGEQGLGPVVAGHATAVGIERAQAHGVAVVGVQNSAHMGRIGSYAEQAAAAGLVSLHFVNTTGFGIQVAPHGGSDRRLSVNPIAMGAPREGAEPLVHDMSTGTVAAGKVRVARNKGELLPAGCLIDNRGRPTRDPEAFFADPPGAITTAAGHKGSGLAIFVEILAGSLTGGSSSDPKHPSADRPVNNLLSILIDPERMAGRDALVADVERLLAWVKASPPIEPGGEVLMPGEVERRQKAKRLEEGLPLDPKTLDQVREAARRVGMAEAEIARAVGTAA